MTASTRALARAGLVVSGAFLVSRVLGWLRLVVIGNTFGASAELDAFFAAFRVPDLLFQLVAAGALSSALIPVIASVMTSDGPARAWRVVSTVLNLMLIALLVMSAIAFVAAPQIVGLIAGGFDEATLEQTVELTRIMLLSPIFLATGAVATSVLNARDRFAAAAVAPIVYNLAIIGAALFLAPSLGVEGLALGVVAGSLSHILVQILPLRAIGFRYHPAIEAGDPAARRALALMGPRAVGLGATQITFVVVTALASTLGVGAVTAFTVAFTLLQVPLGVIGVPLGVVLFPSMSREVASGNVDQLVVMLSRALRLLAVVMIPTAAITALLRVEAVAVLFRAFDLAAVTSTADALLVFQIGLLAHAWIAILARAFYAQQDTTTPVVAAVVAVGFTAVTATILAVPLGLSGIALAMALAAWLEAGILVVILRRRVSAFRMGGVASVAVRTALAAALAAAIGAVVHGLVGPALAPDPIGGGAATILGLAATVIIVAAVYAGVFVAAALALRIDDLRSIVELMIDALRRPRRS